MKDDQHIDALFKAAREEKPKVAYDEVAQKLMDNTSTTSSMEIIKTLINQSVNLNTIIMFIAGSLILLFTWGGYTSESHPQPPTPVMPTPETPVKQQEAKPVTDIQLTSTVTEPAPRSQNTTKPARISEDTSLATPPNQEKVTTPKVSATNGQGIDTFRPIETYDSPISSANPVQSKIDFHPIQAPKSTTALPIREKLLVLNYTDQEPAVVEFASTLTNYMNTAWISPKYNGQHTIITKFTLKIEHPKGLDWQMKVSGFKILEMKLYLNEKDLVEKISYRFNKKGKFSKPMRVDIGQVRSKIILDKDKRSKFQTKTKKN